MESEFNSRKGEQKDIPSVDSNDPNERKLARRMRIQARLEAAEKERAIAEGTYEEPEPEQPLIYETIENSEDTLRQLYLEGKELVTNIIVASNAKEVARRETIVEEKNNRLEKLREESSLALEKLDEISSKWETIMELNGPLELFEHMKEQKAKCLELIQQKNELIKSFQMELKLADEKFMKGRRAMYEELSLLTRRIDEQILLMKRAYRIELNQIEESVDVTRSELIEQHQNTWLSLYNQREKDETTNMDRKFNLVESFHEELHSLHVDHDEKYRAMRIHLETDIQTLEQELEQVKALCLLNSEKLDYNYQVLKKREEENVYIKNHQKRRLNKLQDLVNTLKKKIDEKRLSTEEEYKKLRKDVSRYYKNILDTESKAERFSQVNDEKFNNIWTMKDEEARDLLEKILAADMIISQQILGLEWTPPPNTNFTKSDMIAYKTAENVVSDIKRRRKKGFVFGPLYHTSKDLKENESGVEVLAGHKRLLSHIFELIADQSGFLIEEKLDELLAPYVKDEKTFIRLDNVFVAIGLQTQSELEAMKKIFLPYTTCLFCDKHQTSTTTVEGRIEAKNKQSATSNYSRQNSILHIRELEEKVSKLRVQAKACSEDCPGSDSKTEGLNNSESRKQDSQRSPESTPAGRRRRTDSVGDQQKESPEERERGNEVEAGKNVKCDITHPLVIEKIYVLRALRDFVSVYRAHRIEQLSEIEDKLVHKRITISRLLSKEDILSYWDKYKEAIPTKLEHLWSGLLAALTRYLSVLKDRHELNSKAQALRRRNLELKRLLSRYKIPSICGTDLKLPPVLPVPNEPIEFREMATIAQKLFL